LLRIIDNLVTKEYFRKRFSEALDNRAKKYKPL